MEGAREPFAYAVAFVRERGRWRIELGGVVIDGLAPEPLEIASRLPRVALNVSAGGQVGRVLLWVDSRPLAHERRSDAPFSARGVARTPSLRPGRHHAVGFGFAGGAAGAVAWTFAVRE